MVSYLFYNHFLLLWSLVGQFSVYGGHLYLSIYHLFMSFFHFFTVSVFFLTDLKSIFYLVRMFIFWLIYIKTIQPSGFLALHVFPMSCSVNVCWVELRRKIFMKQIVVCSWITKWTLHDCEFCMISKSADQERCFSHINKI